MALVNLLVEGTLDEQIGMRLIKYCGHEFGVAHGRQGWTWIRRAVPEFAKTAQAPGMNYLALVDLAGPSEICPPRLVSNWLNNAPPGMLLRVAVNAIESWLLADDAGFGRFLGLARSKVGSNPDLLANPKQHLVSLARRSRRRVAQGLVPGYGISASEGRLYTANLSGFTHNEWNVDFARSQSPSLERCVTRLREIPD